MSYDTDIAAVSHWPEPDQRLLTRPPLELVICEIRTISDAPVTLGSQEGLALKAAANASGFMAERLEPAQQAFRMQLVAGDQQPSVTESRSAGWQLISVDGNSVATFLPGSTSIQTTQYKSWEDTFRPMLAAILAAFDAVAHPHIRQRIGLRYVDRLVDPSALKPSDWRERVVETLLGPIADPLFADHVLTSQTQVELSIAENRQALLRHGPFSDGALHGAISYILDIDVFDTSTVAFGLADTLAVSDELNRTALSLFQSALTTSYLAELREKE